MITFQAFARHLRDAAVSCRPGLEVRLEAAMEDVAKDARGLIGHERPEWAPLAESTVSYKQAHGYTGRVSATDPLLREGEMRESIEGGAEGLVGLVGSDDPVALYQEMGTATIPPRPFLALAMQEAQPKLAMTFGAYAAFLLMPRGTFALREGE